MGEGILLVDVPNSKVNGQLLPTKSNIFEVMFPRAYKATPALTVDQMIEVDRLMVEWYGVTLLQMMENAGRSLAVFARKAFLKGRVAGRHIVVLAGSGGNGGGALSAARRLKSWGANVRVVLSRPLEELSAAAAHQVYTLQQMGLVMLNDAPRVGEADLIIDGLIGYSLKGAPHGLASELIQWTNRQITPVLALDLPSGLHGDSGIPADPCIRASATLTLALPKQGLLTAKARPMVGEIYLADIGVPNMLYKAPGIGLEVGAIFSESDIVKLI